MLTGTDAAVYTLKSRQLAADSNVAMQILMGSIDDIVCVPVNPPASEQWLADLRAQWPGRNLRSVGLIGIVNGTPRIVLAEPITPAESDAVVSAWLAAIHGHFCDGLRAAEIGELERIARL
jgi:hypothetical protein